MGLPTFLLAILALIPLVGAAEKPACNKVERLSASCTGTWDTVSYDRTKNVLCIEADFPHNNNILNRLKSMNIRKGVILFIDSYGGDVESTLDVYQYLRRLGYNIVVRRICISSCAQFLFIGANNRYILRGAQIIMHGVPFSDAELSHLHLKAPMSDGVIRANIKFRDFLIKHNASENLLEGGEGYSGKYIIIGGNALWMPSRADFARNKISVIDCNMRDN